MVPIVDLVSAASMTPPYRKSESTLTICAYFKYHSTDGGSGLGESRNSNYFLVSQLFVSSMEGEIE